jgi:polyhydroxybutyrate depolymerase
MLSEAVSILCRPPDLPAPPVEARMIRLSLAVLLTLLAVSAQAAGIRSLSFGGRDRTYLVHRPANLDHSKPAPLVIVLHGGFGSGAQAERSYNWDAESDRHGFVVVYPDGVRRSWNAGGICCGPAYREHVDDVGFLTQLIATVSRAENTDPKRIYLTGMSNGAAMAYRYACEGTVPVAAVGSVSGSFSYGCAKPHAVSVMEIHGLDDRNIPFKGGHGDKAATDVQWLPVERTLDAFRSADGCPVPSLGRDGAVRTEVWRCAAGREVVLVTIAGAGHQWPSAVPAPKLAAWILGLDPPSQALDATSRLWGFFSDHRAD